MKIQQAVYLDAKEQATGVCRGEEMMELRWKKIGENEKVGSSFCY
jgi:hypothetical protein